VISCACSLISRSHLGARNLCIFVLSNFGIVWIGQALRPKTQLCSVAQQATQCLRCLPGPSSACYSWESKSSYIECTCWNTGDCIGSCSSLDFGLSYSDYLRLLSPFRRLSIRNVFEWDMQHVCKFRVGCQAGSVVEIVGKQAPFEQGSRKGESQIHTRSLTFVVQNLYSSRNTRVILNELLVYTNADAFCQG
jgi:hypothetical protein